MIVIVIVIVILLDLAPLQQPGLHRGQEGGRGDLVLAVGRQALLQLSIIVLLLLLIMISSSSSSSSICIVVVIIGFITMCVYMCYHVLPLLLLLYTRSHSGRACSWPTGGSAAVRARFAGRAGAAAAATSASSPAVERRNKH